MLLVERFELDIPSQGSSLIGWLGAAIGWRSGACQVRSRRVAALAGQTSLCRLYDNAVRSVSNSYGVKSTFGR